MYVYSLNEGGIVAREYKLCIYACAAFTLHGIRRTLGASRLFQVPYVSISTAVLVGACISKCLRHRE